MIKDKHTLGLKRKAENYFTKGNFKKALEKYTELKDLLPKDMRVVQKIADIHKKLGNLKEAKSNYKSAAEYFTREGYWAKAVALNKVIISLDPGDKEVQQKIADIYTSQGLSGSKIMLQSPPDSSLESVSPRPRTETEDVIDLKDNEYVDEATDQKGWRIPLFSELGPDAMSELIEKLAVRRLAKGTLICREEEEGNSMFVISEGWVEVSKGSGSKRVILDSLKEGDFFGEFGLLTDGMRHASATARSDVVLLEVTRNHFEELSKNYPSVPRILEEYFRTRTLDNILRKSNLFDSLFTVERAGIIKKLEITSIRKGNYVFREGDRGDKLYFIKSGNIEISVTKDGDQIVIARLATGDFFGEISVLTGKPRTASVKATTSLELLFLDEKSFSEIADQHPQLLGKLKAKMEERAKDTIEAYQSHEEMKRCLGMV